MNYPFKWLDNSGAATAAYGSDSIHVPTVILVILNRWHDMTVNGTTLVTLSMGQRLGNCNAADDGFGNLVCLDESRGYHRTACRDD